MRFGKILLLLQWANVVILSILIQMFIPETNLGILIAILMIPPFVHDIIHEYSQGGKTKK
jgi:uncharacterized membrane protein YccF (DUF307 family)